MRKIIWAVVAAVLTIGVTHADFASALFDPGETLNPSCNPTDPDCKVLTVRPVYCFHVQNIEARDALLDLQPGDLVDVADSKLTYIYSQNRTWEEVLKPRNQVFTVLDLMALGALQNVQVGDYAKVTSDEKTYVRTLEGTWEEILTPMSDTYVVTDIAEMNALQGVNTGDHAIVTSINKTFVRLKEGGWQEFLVPPATITLMKTYVVADEAARDALSNLQAGDIAIVISSNTTYVYTQDSIWQQLLVPTVNQVLSVNGKTGAVVLSSNDIAEGASNLYFTQERAHGAFSVTSPLSYDALSGTFGLSLSAPLALDGSSLTLDTLQITSLLGLNQQNALQLNAFGSGSGDTSEIRFLELLANGSNYVGFKAPDAIGADRIWTLPAADGINGQMLVTNGSGGLQWATLTAGSNISITHGAGAATVGVIASPAFDGVNLNSLRINRGEAITGFFSVSPDGVVSEKIEARTCGVYSKIEARGARPGNTVLATPRPDIDGIENANLSWNAYVSDTDTVIIRACNPTGDSIDTSDRQTWVINVWVP